MALIEIAGVYKDYVGEDVVTHVLRGLDCSIEKGEFVSIMGPSGSGKSTLMHILGFLDTISKGVYRFDGEDISRKTDDELAFLRRGKVGFIFQAFHLLPRMSALENVTLPLIYSHTTKEEREARGKELLASVGLSHRLNHTPNQLSGGEKQRVAIARALVNKPEVIFADEPTGNLDSKSGLQVMKILQSLNDLGHSIILVTHERYTAEHAKRVISMKDGIILKDEKVSQRQSAHDSDELTK